MPTTIPTMAPASTPTFFSLPFELRNAIYLDIFSRSLPDYTNWPSRIDVSSNTPLTAALHLSHLRAPTPRSSSSNPDLRVLQTCRQMHLEASLLALSQTTFHLNGKTARPEAFAAATQPLSFEQQGALRHVTLTARIMHLRALNESWGGLPFGHAGLDLDTLTIVPIKVDAPGSAYAEVADLSQSHTLAYILAETLKRLRNVRVVQVRNHGCFTEDVWRMVYRSLVYRMWRWGGERCGVRFESAREGEGEWFCVWLDGDEEEEGFEVGEEVVRLVGGRDNVPDQHPVIF